MPDRPAIPIEVRREVLFEARHRCAVCCEPLPLQKAHIRPWCKSKDHTAPNLIALCANCHGRADSEGWGESYLRRYKRNPCALAAHAMPPMSPEQRAMVDFVIANNPEDMTDSQRKRFVSMAAAYADVRLRDVEIISVSPTNSTQIRLRVPAQAAQAFEHGFARGDSGLESFFDDFVILSINVAEMPSETPRATDEAGTERTQRHDSDAAHLIGTIAEPGSHYNRHYASMSPEEHHAESALVDKQELTALLVERSDSLLKYIGQKIPLELRDLMSPEDVLQDVWVAVIGRTAPLNIVGTIAFDRWVLTITNNVLVDLRKSVRRMRRPGVRGESARSSSIDLFVASALKERTPSGEFKIKEIESCVNEAVSKLPAVQREVVDLRFLQRNSTAEIAKKLGMGKGTVRAIALRGMASLRRHLGRALRYISDVSSIGSVETM